MTNLECNLVSYSNGGHQIKFMVNSEPATILEFLAAYDGTNYHNPELLEKRMEGIKKYLISSITQFNKRVEANKAIRGLSTEDTIRYLMKAAGKRVLKSGLRVPTVFLY